MSNVLNVEALRGSAYQRAALKKRGAYFKKEGLFT